MMNCKFTNKIKMRKFIEDNINRKITNTEFNNWLDYLKETADYIIQNREKEHIQEKANLTLELDEKEYEIYVKFNQVVEDDKVIFLIDLDYNHFEEI